jgi:hypothetical protein
MNDRTNPSDPAAQNPYAPPGDTVAPPSVPPTPGILRRTLFMLALPWLLFLGIVILSLVWEMNSDLIAIAAIFAVTVPALFVAVLLPVRVWMKVALGIAYATAIWVAFYFLFGD